MYTLVQHFALAMAKSTSTCSSVKVFCTKHRPLGQAASAQQTAVSQQNGHNGHNGHTCFLLGG